METLFAPAFNLSILVAILVWKVREPFLAFVRDRHVQIRDEIQKTGEMLRDAQGRYEEFSAKLKSVDAEASALREQARQDSEAMKVRVLTEAKRLGAVIVADARTAGGALSVELKQQLVRDFASLVVSKAEGLLRDRLTGEDRIRIRQEFSTQVEQVR